MIITLQLQGDTVYVALSREELEGCDRVRVYAPGSRLVFDERNKRERGQVSLAHGATMHIDAYGEKGEGHLLSEDYRREGNSLVLVRTHWNYGIQTIIS